jgi:hypothetical protein
MPNKTVIIDEGVLTAKSIQSWGAQKLRILNNQMPENAFLPPVSYIWFMMAISALKRIGVNKDDLILIARDKTKSFRKIFYKPYKAQRWEQREEKSHIDWMYHYGIIDNFLDQLAESTNWHVIWLPKLFNGADILFTEEGQKYLNEDEFTNEELNCWYGIEADDIIACASKYYSDREVIFVSIDCDLDQLCTRENTKFFTLTQKYKSGTGVYKLVDNGYQVLAKKIEKGDKGDNILPGVTDDNSEKAQNLRKLIIDLLNLPSWVEEECFKVFDNLPKKEIDYSKLPFQNSLARKFPQIYEKDKIITYEDSIKHFANKKKKIAKKSKEARERKKKEKEQLTMVGG